jgi:hypothetical protein
MGDARVARMIEEARAGQITHGSIGGFVRDPSASFNLYTLYVAELLSGELDVPLVRADSAPHGQARPLCGVHLTDGYDVVVSINLQAHVTHEDCLPFLYSAAAARSARGPLNGEQVPSLSRVIIARNARSTLCPVMALIINTYAIIDKPIIDTTELGFLLSMLIDASPIAAIGAAQLAEDDEDDVSYEEDRVEDAAAANKSMALLTLPEHVLENIGRSLPLCSSMRLARACRRLNEAFPSILRSCGDDVDELVLFVRQLDEPQLASIARWMRMRGFISRASVDDMSLIKRWLVRDDNGQLVAPRSAEPPCSNAAVRRLSAPVRPRSETLAC